MVRSSGIPLDVLLQDLRTDYAAPIAPLDDDSEVELWHVGSLSDGLAILAEQAGYRLELGDDAYVFEPASASFVVRSQYLDSDAVAGAVGVAFPEVSVGVAGGHLVVAGDEAAAAVALVGELNADPGAWLLDVLLVELQASAARQLGLDWSLGLTLSGRVEAGSGIDATQGPVLGARASALAEVIGRLSAETRLANLSNRGTLYLLDGQAATMRQGDQIPVPRRITTPEGTVSVVGFENVETGFTLTATATPAGDRVRLNLAPTVSEVSGFVQDEAPILLERSVELVALVRPGEWLVVSGFDRAVQRSSRTGINPSNLLLAADSSSDELSTIIMLVRLTNALEAAP